MFDINMLHDYIVMKIYQKIIIKKNGKQWN